MQGGIGILQSIVCFGDHLVSLKDHCSRECMNVAEVDQLNLLLQTR